MFCMLFLKSANACVFIDIYQTCGVCLSVYACVQTQYVCVNMIANACYGYKKNVSIDS